MTEYKTCYKCKKIFEKSSENFYKDSRKRDGLNIYCKKCRKKVSSISSKKRYKENPLKFYDSNLRNLYGITYDDYLELLKKQNYRCAICGFTLEEVKSRYGGNNVRNFHIDHCHKTKKIRGILCQKCNRGLGLFKDNPFMLIKAAKYIKKNKK